MDSKRQKTGLVYDTRMTEHRCLWNDGYPERPERFTRILARCNELKLIERCHSIPSRPATLNEILLKHTQEHYDLLKTTDGETDEQKLEEMCTHYDVFIHPSTFELSLLAVGCAVELVDKILIGEVQNGMAVIRPPGHHAMEKSFDGFCFFNNVAIAAQHAITNHGINRILVVDFDVHHGQGTQQLFYDDPRLLYFSIHRYDHGTFFPGLRESDFDYVGEGRGEGFNFNVPLNKKGMTNADYLAIWQQILLPVAMEYQPEMVLISAGYDAAYGCALGDMEITPACYAHLISPLMSLAGGKVAAFLEGGYHLDSLAESAAITLRTFLGDPCPLLEMLDEPSDSVQESILNCTQSHKAFWKCLQVHKEYNPDTLIGSECHRVIQKFIDDKTLNPWFELECYNTRVLFPNQCRSEEEETKISEHLQHLKSVTNLEIPSNRTCFVFPGSKITKEKFEQFLLERKFIERLHELEVSDIGNEKLKNLVRSSTKIIKFSDPNFLRSSSSALTLELLHNILDGKYVNGICIQFEEKSVDPSDLQTSIFDHVKLAAQSLIELQDRKRVLIVDFGTSNKQDVDWETIGEQTVLFISLDHSSVPLQNSKKDTGGFNVNIPINKETANDIDYVAAFQRIIMPIAYEFNPELVLVSVNSNKILADNVSSETFGYLTHWLSALANGKMIFFMEGDYNPVVPCIKTLLGDSLPMLGRRSVSNVGIVGIIQNVIDVQQKYWKSLKFQKMLPGFGK